MNEKTENTPFIMWIVLLMKAITMVAFIQFSPIGLGPDEAQYWTWSKQLDWGYYSKPPAIAWQIWFGTQLFGDTELGVRFGAVILGVLLPLAVFLLAQACTNSEKTPYYAAIAMALTPLGVLSSFFAITDTGITLFWILACWSVVYALQKGESPNYMITGAFIALGALFKWPAYAFWLIILGMLPFVPIMRSRSLFLGILISLLGLAPSVYWNASHEWATFKHVINTIFGGQAGAAAKPNFFEFFAAQFALISPILFILLIIACYYALRQRQPLGIRFLVISSLSILGSCIFLSLFKKIQGNWGAYAYPPTIVLITWYCVEKWKDGIKWLQGGLILSVVLIAFVLSIPTLQGYGVPIPFHWSPFKHNVGWNKLQEELAMSEEHFLFGDKYQTASILSFYNPKQKRAYFLNVHGIRKNQFSYWPGMEDEQVGKNGYFVLIENCPDKDLQECIDHYQGLLKEYFQEVRFVKVKPLFQMGDKMVKEALFFQCIGYNGKKPSEVELY